MVITQNYEMIQYYNSPYYFFARITGGANHEDAYSTGLELTTTSKQAVVIEATVNDKVYDGYGVMPPDHVTARIGDMAVSGLNYAYTWYEKGSVTPLVQPPKNAGDYYLIISVAADDPKYTGQSGPIYFTIKKAPRTITLTKGTASHNSVYLERAIISDGADDGVVEYSAGQVNAAPEDGWQASTLFAGLPADTTRYYFARVTDGLNYSDAVSDGMTIKTLAYSAGREDRPDEPGGRPDSQDNTPPEPSSPPKYPIFSDVPDDTWYTEEVNRLAEIGIVKGFGDGAFRPEAAITRAEVAVMISRILDYSMMNGSLHSTGSG